MAAMNKMHKNSNSTFDSQFGQTRIYILKAELKMDASQIVYETKIDRVLTWLQ